MKGREGKGEQKEGKENGKGERYGVNVKGKEGKREQKKVGGIDEGEGKWETGGRGKEGKREWGKVSSKGEGKRRKS